MGTAAKIKSVPKPKQTEADDHLYVSPTSEDTPAKRYEEVRTQEAKISNEELLQAIRTPSLLFPDEEESDE